MAEMGALAIASRLRRLSDLYWQSVTAIYRESGIDFEVKWATVFLLIARQGPIPIMEIADRLGITHPAVIQIVNELVKKGLIQSEKSEQDSRKRLLTLSPAGEAIIPQMQPLWDAVQIVSQDLIDGQPHNLLLALREMEDQLTAQSFASRIRTYINQIPAPSGSSAENRHD